jgi:hypothetical protein
MRPRYALTLQSQLALPLVPFVIDLGARIILLWDKVAWYQLPDLWTFLVTYAFFCIGLMIEVNPRELPTDAEANIHVELVRQRLLAYGIFSVTFAGAISVFRAINDLLPNQHLAETRGLALFAAVIIFFVYTFFQICRTHLSYVNRGG